MKKKVLLILTIIISMVLCIDRVVANTFPELTCIYDKTSTQPGIKLVQSSDGNLKLYISPSNAIDITEDTNWIFLNKKLIGSSPFSSKYSGTKLFQECPKCVKYDDKGGNITYDCDSTSGSRKKSISGKDENYAYRIINMSSRIVINEKNQSDNTILSGKWKAKCTYGNENDKIEIFFTNSEFKMYKNNIDITNSITIGKLSIVNKITSDILNEEYDKYLGDERCLNAIYENDVKCVSGCKGKPTSKKFETTYSNDKNSSSTATKYDLIEPNFNTGNENVPAENVSDCDSLFGQDTIEFINEIMKWIRIAVPLLLVAFGIFDFSQAVFSSSEDNIKKIREKFFKRIIAAVLVFLSPLFVKLILNLSNEVWDWINPNTCIK